MTTANLNPNPPTHRSIINLRIVREVVEGAMGHSACLIEPELKRYSLKLKN